MKRLVFCLMICFLLTGCRFNRHAKYFDPYGNEIDMPFEELCAKVVAEDYAALSEEDIQGWNDSTLSDSYKGPSVMDEYEYYRHRADSLENLLKCK